MISASTLIHYYSVDNFFSLKVFQNEKKVRMTMQFSHDHLSTNIVPSIVPLLHERLPGILKSKCFNTEKLPFLIEVKNTETGHLFEHIVLAYLYELKVAKGFQDVIFNGRTHWNWTKDPRGTFHIIVDCGVNDSDILEIAVAKAITLMKIIFQ